MNHIIHLQARAFENLYKEEMRRREELEKILAKERQSFEASNKQKEEELLIYMDRQASLENQISASVQMMEQLNDRIVASERMLEIFRKERDDLEVERDNAIEVTQEILRNQASEASSSQREGFLSEFSFLEIQRATDNFEPSMKIGEDGYWSIYRGFLHHTQVAVKMLQSDCPRAPSQFHEEVRFLMLVTYISHVPANICPTISFWCPKNILLSFASSVKFSSSF